MAPASRPRSPYGNDSRRTTSTACSEPRSPMRDDRPAASTRHGVRADGLDPDARRRAVTSSATSRATISSVSPTSRRDGVADLGRVGDVVEVAAAGVGEVLEEPLVEVVADPERRGRHAPGPERGRVGGELAGVGDADVGEAVRQQQAPVRRRRSRGAPRPARSRAASRRRGSCCPGLDARAAGRSRRAGLGGRRRRLDDDVDDIVVDDDAEPVVGLEPRDAPPRRPASRCRAWRPDIEPERSRTIARLTGGRRARPRSRAGRDDVDRARNARCGRWRG